MSYEIYFILLHYITGKYIYIDIKRKALIGEKLFELQKNFNLMNGGSCLMILLHRCFLMMKKNWNLFYHIHYKRRKRLEHNRLNDIVHKKKEKVQYDPIDYESINLMSKEIVEKASDLLSNIEHLLHDIDVDFHQSGGGGSTLYVASLDSSGPDGGKEGEDYLNKTNLQMDITVETIIPVLMVLLNFLLATSSTTATMTSSHRPHRHDSSP
ncbi:hypothetical protein Ahy_A02g007377 [Arachis hypogaea]|uniref:Uncharacterized protein n=1 Tax=Arachis hypogaea TaxID=3818 RepID=A0A445ECC5_ARAHY|nr:hypothetical protein Ahy_A02g007377 [Arachis hypogaea]